MKKLLVAGLLFLLAGNIFAETTLFEILKIYPDARQTSLGASGVSAAPGPFAAYSNPALIIREKQKSLGLSYNQYVADIYLSHLGLVLPKKNIAFGLLVNYLGSSGITQTDIDADGKIVYTNKQFSYNSSAVGLTVAGKFGNNSLGTEIKYVTENSAGDNLSGLSGSLGWQSQRDNFSLGVVLKDFGLLLTEGVQENGPFPTRLICGISLQSSLGKKITGVWSVDGEYQFAASRLVGHFGQEIVVGAFSLRLGIKTATINSLGPLSGLSAGLGYNLKNISLDYAFVPFGDLGNINRLSFGIKF